MIRVSNALFGENSIHNMNWQLTDTEQETVRLMSSSSITYWFRTPYELRFELLLRLHTILAAKALNASNASFSTFANSRCNPAYWHRTDNGGFQLRTDVKSSGGIRDIFINGQEYGFECATAVVIVFYKAVLDCIDENRFDDLFANLYLHDWHFDRDLHLGVTRHADKLPGDVYYFENPDVDPKKMHWQGENTVFLGKGLFYGHGIGIRSADGIMEVLNRNRIPNATQPARMLDQATRPDFRYLSQFAKPHQDLNRISFPQYGPVSPFPTSRYLIAAIGSDLYIA
ncbi:protein-glutamine gamma-glutamyltransferase [Ferviditalea candida]|uniref:Protein-glutamine gamma-glutamyltransferase n=1 Tax=Ferviditalea candida TaxID=3108399 RepID=A0ABU5ZED9_9BACL|nr:protein-glutamine gamma-glutamyltransferase [Paenibacillaceae bacterium T2]